MYRRAVADSDHYFTLREFQFKTINEIENDNEKNQGKVQYTKVRKR